MKRKYFWTDINKNVKQYVEFCMTCQKIKTVKHKLYEFLNFLFVFENFRKNWIMNFIIDLFFNNYKNVISDSILMIMNRYTKFAKYILIKKIWTTEDLADAMINIVFIQFEKLIFIVIDRNFFFTFNFWSVFCYHMWTQLRYNIVYHFQTDEQTEKQNQIFEIYLKCYVNYQQNDWIKWFSTTKFVYNNNFHFVTNKSSFELIFDDIVDLNQKIQKFYKKKISIVRNRIVIFANIRKYLKLKWTQTTRSIEKNYNKKHFHVKFNADQMMFLNAKNIRSIRSSKKLNYKYYDSYRMLKFVERISYKF